MRTTIIMTLCLISVLLSFYACSKADNGEAELVDGDSSENTGCNDGPCCLDGEVVPRQKSFSNNIRHLTAS